MSGKFFVLQEGQKRQGEMSWCTKRETAFSAFCSGCSIFCTPPARRRESEESLQPERSCSSENVLSNFWLQSYRSAKNLQQPHPTKKTAYMFGAVTLKSADSPADIVMHCCPFQHIFEMHLSLLHLLAVCQTMLVLLCAVCIGDEEWKKCVSDFFVHTYSLPQSPSSFRHHL